jgi:uncharacterized phiE125 gp8 family phage protein
MQIRLKTEPDGEPLSVSELEGWLRLDTAEENEIIAGLIVAARQQAESFTNRALLRQAWELVLSGFHTNEIKLPFPKLLQVVSVKYYDSNNQLKTLSSADYQVVSDAVVGLIKPTWDRSSWPSTYTREDAVVIEFQAGFGDREDIPEPILTAMKLLVAHYYENRQPVVTGTIVAQMPMLVGFLLSPYKVHYL